jgi:hypothetical protein
MKNKKGSAILTTPIIIAIGIMFIAGLIVLAVEIITPYIWYERLSSTCIKYIFVMEEYGYLTKQEATKLKEELISYGFDEEKLKIKYTASRVAYGNPIFLETEYSYQIKFPLLETKTIPMEITRTSVSKR